MNKFADLFFIFGLFTPKIGVAKHVNFYFVKFLVKLKKKNPNTHYKIMVFENKKNNS